MKTLVELICFSEDSRLLDCIDLLKDRINGFQVNFSKKGEEIKLFNGKKGIQENTMLNISCSNDDYNTTIPKLLDIRQQIQNWLRIKDFDCFINLSFFSQDMVSLELSEESIQALAVQNLTMPISIYHQENGK
jgi:hypothetical protein